MSTGLPINFKDPKGCRQAILGAVCAAPRGIHTNTILELTVGTWRREEILRRLQSYTRDRYVTHDADTDTWHATPRLIVDREKWKTTPRTTKRDPPRKATRHDHDRVNELFAAGTNLEEIAHLVGIGYGVVRRIIGPNRIARRTLDRKNGAVA